MALSDLKVVYGKEARFAEEKWYVLWANNPTARHVAVQSFDTKKEAKKKAKDIFSRDENRPVKVTIEKKNGQRQNTEVYR